MRVLLLLLLFSPALSLFASDLTEEQIKMMEREFDSLPINTFRFLGNQIICKMEEADDEHACHRIGHIKVGSDYQPKAEPYKEIQHDNGITSSVFVIASTEKHQSYIVIGHKNEKIVSVQYTGNYPHEKLTFATIGLMDSKEKVQKVLGPRYKVSTVDEISGEKWDYFPFPISIEFKNNHVYSMRVAEHGN